MKNGLEFNKHLTISGKRRENCRLTLDVEECANSQLSATVSIVQTDSLLASSLLSKMRIRFGAILALVMSLRQNENTVWTDSQLNYGF
jgi:hypothetical protein